MGLRDWYQKFVAKRDAFSAVEEEERIRDKLAQRKLSANERELNKFLEADRQKEIKNLLSRFRNRERDEVWHGTTPLDAPNVITRQKDLFFNQPNLFKLKKEGSEKNLFWG